MGAIKPIGAVSAAEFSPDESDAPRVQMWGLRQYEYTGENLGSGNRCGHDPEKLAIDRLALPAVKGGHLPHVLKRVMKRAVEFFAKPDIMGILGFHQDKHNKDGSLRQVRTENREAVALVIHAMMSYLDLASLCLGTYRPDGSFVNATALDLAARCDMVCVRKDPDNPGLLKQVPTSRFWRAFRWLESAGAFQVFEQYEEKENGDKRARPAIKPVNELFLRRLGSISEGMMTRSRNKSYARTGEFLSKAANFDIVTTDELSELDRALALEKIHREVFGPDRRRNAKPEKKNKPVTVKIQREVSYDLDSVRTRYNRYEQSVLDRITKDLGRELAPGFEQYKLFTKHGGLNFTQWKLANGLLDDS